MGSLSLRDTDWRLGTFRAVERDAETGSRATYLGESAGSSSIPRWIMSSQCEGPYARPSGNGTCFGRGSPREEGRGGGSYIAYSGRFFVVNTRSLSNEWQSASFPNWVGQRPGASGGGRRRAPHEHRRPQRFNGT